MPMPTDYTVLDHNGHPLASCTRSYADLLLADGYVEMTDKRIAPAQVVEAARKATNARIVDLCADMGDPDFARSISSCG